MYASSNIAEDEHLCWHSRRTIQHPKDAWKITMVTQPDPVSTPMKTYLATKKLDQTPYWGVDSWQLVSESNKVHLTNGSRTFPCRNALFPVELTVRDTVAPLPRSRSQDWNLRNAQRIFEYPTRITALVPWHCLYAPQGLADLE